MSDLKERLRGIEGLAPPDLWNEITSRDLLPLPSEPGPGRRIVVAMLSLVLAAAGFALVSRAFRPSTDSARITPGLSASNGPIWALGAGGEAGTLIYAVDPVTGSKTPLWSDGRNLDFSGFEVAPQLVGDDYAFSLDGSTVAFSHYVGEGAADQTKVEIFVMNADGSGLTQVTHDDAYNAFPSWSPDGTEIVYTSYRGDEYIPGCLATTLCPGDLYVIGVDGTSERRLTNDPDDESMPSWSPDGETIVFQGAASGSPGTLRVIDADGTGQSELIAGPGGWALNPEWSPDGSQILFLGGTAQETVGVWVVSAEGTDLHQVADINAGLPAVWSPNGEEIAFANLVSGESQLWVANADGSEPHLVTELPRYGIRPLAWQPLPASLPDSPSPTASSPGSSPSAPAALTRGTAQHEAQEGIWVLTPLDWSYLARPSGPYEPSTLFAVASYPIERGGDCAPTTALEALPADGALAWVIEYRDTQGNEFPPRPERFSLDPSSLSNYECSGTHATYMFRFQDEGRYFQVHVAFGEQASADLQDEMLASLSSLVVDLCPPAEPPVLVSEFGSLIPDHGAAGEIVTLSGPTGRDGNWFWSSREKIEVWWSPEPIGVPEETGAKLLLASIDPRRSCDFTVTFPTPDVPPGRYVITILGYHQGEGFGWMGERRFTVTE